MFPENLKSLAFKNVGGDIFLVIFEISEKIYNENNSCQSIYTGKFLQDWLHLKS